MCRWWKKLNFFFFQFPIFQCCRYCPPPCLHSCATNAPAFRFPHCQRKLSHVLDCQRVPKPTQNLESKKDPGFWMNTNGTHIHKNSKIDIEFVQFNKQLCMRDFLWIYVLSDQSNVCWRQFCAQVHDNSPQKTLFQCKVSQTHEMVGVPGLAVRSLTGGERQTLISLMKAAWFFTILQSWQSCCFASFSFTPNWETCLVLCQVCKGNRKMRNPHKVWMPHSSLLTVNLLHWSSVCCG